MLSLSTRPRNTLNLSSYSIVTYITWLYTNELIIKQQGKLQIPTFLLYKYCKEKRKKIFLTERQKIVPEFGNTIFSSDVEKYFLFAYNEKEILDAFPLKLDPHTMCNFATQLSG
jgi:hypothetical protein